MGIRLAQERICELVEGMPDLEEIMEAACRPAAVRAELARLHKKCAR